MRETIVPNDDGIVDALGVHSLDRENEEAHIDLPLVVSVRDGFALPVRKWDPSFPRGNEDDLGDLDDSGDHDFGLALDPILVGKRKERVMEPLHRAIHRHDHPRACVHTFPSRTTVGARTDRTWGDFTFQTAAGGTRYLTKREIRISYLPLLSRIA